MSHRNPIPGPTRDVRLYVGVVLLLGIITWLDYLIPYELSLFSFYFIPIAIAAWHRGKIAGISLALLATSAWFMASISSPAISLDFVLCWNTGMRMAAFIAIAIVTGRLGSEVRKLRNLLPICSWCKKIRDDTGYWEQLEEYYGKRDGMKFSHGICPDCAEHFYQPHTLFIGPDRDQFFALKDAFLKTGLPHLLHHVDNSITAMEWLSGGASYSFRHKFPMPDILIIDGEREGEDCFRFLGWLREQGGLKEIPLVLLDSFQDQERVQRAYAMGVDSCFPNSTHYRELTEFLRPSRT